ncbi:MAG: hypothetical protein DYG84_02045 [Candidatus Brocadia sp. AMX3]|nr:hypothetical protein [Candidatus Brocadia fulgida]MCC6324423.1 hypothetical protein [Candidatus Brocadia sp.]MCE7910515.1 hypothetical protein [Candidatus Brocadia sp. AMX3]MDG5996487.1 hypothetical protein [Candidatus Brocadia sp.]
MKPSNRGFPSEFDWKLYPHAEYLLSGRIDKFLHNNNFARELASAIERNTSTRFPDWIDHMVLHEDIISATALKEAGFEEAGHIAAPHGMRVFIHRWAIFFPVLFTRKEFTEVALKPERLDHFIQVMGKGFSLQGSIYGPYRKAIVSAQGDHILSAVERRGYNGFCVSEKATEDTGEYRQALEGFFCRQRYYESLEDGMHAVQKLIEDTCKRLTPARATDAFFRAERAYWERRNWAGQIQKARQDRLGLGWGNHDHHTYRSSRENFTRLIKIFETLGFVCREQFFAGEEAGWGAQVLEHPECNIVLFTDIDLLKEERDKDFAREGLTQTSHRGTVGLWVELHGESILQSGLHHLAARFDFEKLSAGLKQSNVNTMPPFSYFEFLKQAFTDGETWRVDTKRLDDLLKKGSITGTQRETFHKTGAISSHLENIQRTQGFKGFNQHSVSAIITATDPRKYKVQETQRI